MLCCWFECLWLYMVVVYACMYVCIYVVLVWFIMDKGLSWCNHICYQNTEWQLWTNAVQVAMYTTDVMIL